MLINEMNQQTASEESAAGVRFQRHSPDYSQGDWRQNFTFLPTDSFHQDI